MKKLILAIALALVFLIGAGGADLFAASTQTEVHFQHGSLHIIEIDWTSDAGTYTDYLIRRQINGTLYMVETDPLASAPPNDNYDITLTNSQSYDVMGGSLANRDTSNTETAQPYISDSASYGALPVWGRLTLAISNTGVYSVGKIRIFYYAK